MHPTCNIQQCWELLANGMFIVRLRGALWFNFILGLNYKFPLFQVHKHTSPKLYFVLI